jgi:predicted DsbA family dithiol-disulfide isomerase
MKVEIWSDVVCPFCYLGKRRFEAAMQQFAGANQIEVVWHSFLLDPELKGDGKNSPYEYLAKRKGMSLEQSKQMHQQVTDMALEVGLEYHYENAIVANSVDAHRLLQLAKQHNLGDPTKELLMKAYFIEGKDIASHETLQAIGAQVGLDAQLVADTLASDQYLPAVEADVIEAQQIGVRGVPFFVFDRKYAISGAQPADAFLGALQTSFAEWQKNNPVATLQVQNGPSCEVDGDC